MGVKKGNMECRVGEHKHDILTHKLRIHTRISQPTYARLRSVRFVRLPKEGDISPVNLFLLEWE
jgi:hypothetical protein